MTNEAVIDKVRKLLRLADPSMNDSEHQRDLAMKKAQELMFQHDLEMFEIGEESEGSKATHEQINVQGKTRQWQGMLLHYLATPFGCKVIYTRYSPSLSVWSVIGTPDNIAAVKVLHEALVPWLKAQAAISRRAAMPSNPNAFNRAFFDQAGRIINVRLQAQRDSLASTGTGMELVVVRDRQNEDYIATMFGNLRKDKSRGFSNEAGRMHGHVAGHRADLTPKKLSS